MNRPLIRLLTVYSIVTFLIGLVTYIPFIRPYSGTITGILFLLGAFISAQIFGLSDADIGLTLRPIKQTFLPAVIAAIIIFPLYTGGYIVWQKLQGNSIKQPIYPLKVYPQDLYFKNNKSNLWFFGNTLFIRPQRASIHIRGIPEGCISDKNVTQFTFINMHQCSGLQAKSQHPITPGIGAPQSKKVVISRSYWNLFLLFLVEIFAVAFPEELFYRGLLQTLIKGRFGFRLKIKGIFISSEVIIVSVLFAIGHIITVPSAFRLAVFFPSLVFGYLRERSNSITSSVLFHASSNVILLILQGFVLLR